MSAQCTLIADQTDDAVQLALGFVALSSLYCKWHFETPRRPAKIWFMDAMKQGTSALMIHVLNIFSAIATANFSAQPSDADECAFYFMNVVIDTTLGVYIAYLLLNVVTAFAMRRNWPSLKHPGRYGDPPSLRVWTIQLLSWMGVLVVMKAIVAIAIYIFRTPLGFMGSLLFYPVHNHPKVELLIVMIGCPLVMNMVQFWIQDSFLKDHGDREALPLLNKPVSNLQVHAGPTPANKKKVGNLSGLVGDKTQNVAPKQEKTASNAEDMYNVL
ncbi:hypothetical protein Poli38472_013733 [Pythium oligandrum]|uniref:Uncharacterized protein n=1 Tax=Pythium oligandrum TaxID=41045 RepID=A0A8K1CDP7_PYTOL|nr:hypothetical protein Poli38472_013733 [Pythium oligandrum]|eukprot:TMW61270.1 hypothetical protein Poli38472_013733 [Pythium oligandrum]